MTRKRVALIAGSPTGEALIRDMEPLLATLRDLVELDRVELGADAYRHTGVPLPAETLDRLRACAALLVAAPPGASDATDDIAPGVLEHGIVFALRRELRLAVNVRSFHGVGERNGVDIAVVRENSEGAYFADGVLVGDRTPSAVAVQSVVTTAGAVERCLRHAFELAAARRHRLVIAHKVRVLTAAGALWTQAAERIGPEFGDVEWQVENIDTCCGRVSVDPWRYDVIASDNVFGDILADVVAAASGAGDYSASIEFDPDGTGPALFEPMHDIPTADGGEASRELGMTAAVGHMLHHLGFPERGSQLLASVRERATATGNPGSHRQ